jgi:L-glutamine-phosphate cytidylyltransferase
MKAVILAAGQGTRIRLVHGQHPKCLIQVDEKTILDHQLEALAMAGIYDVGIVVGYEQEQIIDHVKSRARIYKQQIHFIENPSFAATNNIYSLWLAVDWLYWLRRDSFMVLNADVIFDPEILIAATRSAAPISMIVDPSWRDETMKVIVDGDRVIKMSKKISRNEFSGTYIGITVFSAAIQDTFFRKMNELISVGRVNEFFNAAVQELADDGIHVGFTSTEGLPWAEIDDPLDLMFAQQNVFPQLVERVL